MARVPAKKWETRDDVVRRVEDVREAIDAEPGRISLEALAESAALSPYHFHRIFKSMYGVTPNAYVHERRLRKAHLLLSLGEANATQACVEIGFESLSTFSRAFRKRFGYPPSKTPRKWRAH